MHKMLKTTLVLGLAGAFTIGAVLCCCVRHIVPVKAHACCASKHADHRTDSGQCPSSLKIAEAAQLTANTSSLVSVFKVLPANTAFVPRFCAVDRQTIWINGPPGFSSVVPLYTQFHQLRV